MKENKNKSWKEMHTAEKAGLIIGWALMAALIVYWLLPSTPQPQVSPESVVDTQKPAVYKEASTEALQRATRYLEELDATLNSNVTVLTSGKLQEQSKQSMVFNSLVEIGQEKFGRSVFEPLGHCYSAGVNARTLWHAEMGAARNDGVERLPGSIKDARDLYKAAYQECLASADPVAVAKKNAETDAELRGKFGGGRECLKVYIVDAEIKQTSVKPRPAHCKVDT